MVRLQGELIAPRALEWLASASNPRIHSLYRQSVNLIDPRQDLLSIVLPDLGAGPFAVVASPGERSFKGFDTLNPENQVIIRGYSIKLGHIHIDWEGAENWQPRPNWLQFGEELNETRISQLMILLQQFAPQNSFAPLADDSLPEPDQTFQSKAMHAAAGPAKQLQASLGDGNLGGVEWAVERLAGLGGGVTPSGDDYLQGAIHALWSRVDKEQAWSISRVIVGAAVPRTNAISGAWLKAAARGEAGSDWHLLVEALTVNRGLDEVVIQLILRGHTSGADALAGFLSTLPALR
ncbi:MAG: DUF2877 domain-containing protein [Anaerolineales bacterium]